SIVNRVAVPAPYEANVIDRWFAGDRVLGRVALVLLARRLFVGSTVGCARTNRCDHIFTRIAQAVAASRIFSVDSNAAHDLLRLDVLAFWTTRARHSRIHCLSRVDELTPFRKVVPCGLVWPLVSFVADIANTGILRRLSVASCRCRNNGFDSAHDWLCRDAG